MKVRFSIAFALILSALPAIAGNAKNYTYLALGDSIPFGLDIRLLPPIAPYPPLPTAGEFIGYPDVVADAMHLSQPKKMVNLACPGETSGSFLSSSARDNGCSGPGPGGQPPFKTVIGLHTNYDSTQMQATVSELSGNRHIDLVTLSIGGNDLILLQRDCAVQGPLYAQCVQAGLPAVLQTYAENLAAILSGIRSVYAGRLILVNYYSPSSDPLSMQAIAALNDVMAQVSAPFTVQIADAFTAFQLASALSGGDPCEAGLVVRLSPTVCDIHPTPAGRDVIAASVLLMIGKKNGK